MVPKRLSRKPISPLFKVVYFMSVFNRSILPPPAGGTPSGDGCSQDPAVDPMTGKPYGSGRPNQHIPPASPWPDCRQPADAATDAKLSAIEAESRAASRAAQAINPRDVGAGGMTVGGE
jgi:hypothetical protein